MVICLPVRSSATLDFMMRQAENRIGGIVFAVQAHDVRERCDGGPERQEDACSSVTDLGPPRAGHSTHVRWVGE